MKTKVRKLNIVYEDVDCRGELSSLEKILNTWLHVQKDYLKYVSPDLPFWYGERPQVGFLAAAAVKEGAVTLEEWRTHRTNENHDTSDGRNDLWFLYAYKQWFFEAKYFALPFDDKEWPTKLKSHMNNATAQVRAVDIEQNSGEHLVAVVFVALTWKKEEGDSGFQDALGKWKAFYKKGKKNYRGRAILIIDKCNVEEAYKETEEASRVAGLAVFLDLVP